MKLNNNQQAFLELVRAGLWEKDACLLPYGNIDFKEIYRLAQEQAVIGHVAAGFEHVKDVKIPQELALTIASEVLQLEQRNTSMNYFIGELVDKMREADIYALLIKGQGVAQCYERPLWRACGDIDFYLNEDNFQKVKHFFKPLVSSFDPDNEYTRHINMHYDPWIVEIHGNQYCSLSLRINRVLDEIHLDLFERGQVRLWDNQGTTVTLPSSDNDILIVFTHFLNHFYRGGSGIRQICDWCRLLWTFRDFLDRQVLEKRLRKMGVVSIWKAFATLAVDYLGMPEESMPLYENSLRWKRKADRIMAFLLEVGNFGHNRDTSYYANNKLIQRKCISFHRRLRDVIHHMAIFPYQSLRFMIGQTYYGLKAFVQGG